MSIDVKDLPPAYQAQAFRKLAERERKKQEKGHGLLSTSAASCQQVTGKLKSKYRNKPTERVTAAGNVLRFASQKEARRYDELIMLERAGEIQGLRMQVDFTLQEAYTDEEGRRVRAIRYKADFVYERRTVMASVFVDGELMGNQITWVKVVEDAKSRPTKTEKYIIKRKLMKERFNIDIQEV